MKKFISIFTVVILLISITNVAMAASSTKINASFSNKMGLSAKDWYSTAESRATLTVSVAIDTFTSFKNFDADILTELLSNNTWVGLSKNQRQVSVVGYYGSTNLLFMIYTPSSGQIEYTEMKISTSTPLDDSMIELMVVQALSDQSSKYMKNDKSDVLGVIASLFD